MLRIVLLVVTAAFVGFIGVATVLDMIHHGVTWLDVLALLVYGRARLDQATVEGDPAAIDRFERIFPRP